MPPTRHILLVTFSITLLTFIGIVNCFYTTQASLPLPLTSQITSKNIGGRWELVQVSLGLKPLLPRTISLPSRSSTSHPPSRIDFRRRKRVEPPLLHFAHDALHENRLSLKELVVSLRRVAYAEASNALEVPRSESKRGRSRLGRGPIYKGHVTTSH